MKLNEFFKRTNNELNGLSKYEILKQWSNKIESRNSEVSLTVQKRENSIDIRVLFLPEDLVILADSRKKMRFSIENADRFESLKEYNKHLNKEIKARTEWK